MYNYFLILNILITKIGRLNFIYRNKKLKNMKFAIYISYNKICNLYIVIKICNQFALKNFNYFYNNKNKNIFISYYLV